jgi:hypothetical protein
MSDEQIENISLETWLKNARPFATNLEAYIAISKAIIAARDAQWSEMLGERNFCPRCGKRTKDIHTCTPPVVGFGKVLGTFGVVESWPDTTKEVK